MRSVSVSIRAAALMLGACAQAIRLQGHSHMSEIYAINTGDRVLTDALRAFIAGR